MKRIALILLVIIICSFGVLANPLFNSIGAKSVVEGDTLSFTVTNSAPDNGSSQYRINDTAPVGGVSTFNILGNQATLTYIDNTSASFSWNAPLVSQNTVRHITLSVTDANSSDSEDVAITVLNKAAGPVMDAIAGQAVNEQQTLSVTVTCTAPDNGTTTFSLGNPAIGSITKINDTEATFTYTAPAVSADTTLSQTIAAADADSESSVSFTITVNDLGGGLSVSDIKFGSDTQERSNPDKDEEVYDNADFTITNNDASTATNVQVVWPSSSKYNITFVSATVAGISITNGYQWASLAPGDSITVTLRGRIPEDLSSFFSNRDNPQDDRDVDIGDLTLTASGFSSETSDVLMEAENNLEIKRLYVSINGNEERVDDGDEVDKIEPDSKIEIRLIAENKYSSSSNIRMENVEFSAYSDDSDFDLDENQDIGSISERDTKEETVSYTVDSDIDEDTYRAIITLEGEDENGADQGEQWEIDFTIEKEDKKIAIRRLELDKDEIDLCNDRSANLRVTLENQGNDDSDEIVLIVQNRALDIFSRTLKIDLNENDDYTKTVTLNIPSDATPGTYQIEAITYFDLGDYDDEDINQYATVPLKINECKEETTTPPPSNNQGGDVTPPNTNTGGSEVVVVTNQTTTTIPAEGGAVATTIPTTSKSSSAGNTAYFLLIILAYIVVIALIIRMVIGLFRK